MNDDTTKIKHNIERNKLVRLVADDEYEPVKLRVSKKRRNKLDKWLQYVALALVLESISTLLNIYADWMFVTIPMINETVLLSIRGILGITSLIVLLAAFRYLFGSRKKRIMKEIRNDELL